MNSCKKLEEKLMDLRLPLPQQRLTLARGMQRVATVVGHHHFAQLTEVACGRIEAEMKPRERRVEIEERQREKVPKQGREERRRGKQKVKRNRRSEEVDGAEREEEEYFASGALGLADGENIDGRRGEGIPEERARTTKEPSTELPPTEAQPREEREMQHRFGQPWPGGSSQGREDKPSTRKRSSRHRENNRASHRSDKSHQRHVDRKSHSQPERHTNHEKRSRRHHSKEQEHKRRRRKHTHVPSSPLPSKKEKLDWKVLLRGFMKGIAAFEMNELQKKTSATHPPSQPSQPRAQRPSSGRRRRTEPTNQPPRTNDGQPHGSSTSRSPSPSPSRGRPGLRHASSDDLPPLTPDQIHWREVRAREQGQAEILRTQEMTAAAAHQREEQQQRSRPGDVESLAYGENPFAGPIPTLVPAPTPRVPDMSEIAVAAASESGAAPRQAPVVESGWSFPVVLAATSAATPESVGDLDPTRTSSPHVPTSHPSPPRWGDPIKERENRQKRRN